MEGVENIIQEEFNILNDNDVCASNIILLLYL